MVNGSFEEYSKCNCDDGEIDFSIGWFQQVGSTDYYNACCKRKNLTRVPFNKSGFQQPFGIGNAYAGLFLFYHEKKDRSNGYFNREYLHTKFREPLEANRKYLISFYYSMADSSVFYTDHFSVNLSREKTLKYYDGMEDVLIGEHMLSEKVGKVDAMDTVNWHKVEFQYLSKGKEEYLTVGFFKSDLSKRGFQSIVEKNRLRKTNTFENACYYYIDNVSVVPMKVKEEFSHQ
ncbi:hypothetical protein [Chryseolinea lacunae]|uniref:Uncharacterized protein n=1 Tax=Chryseolinea lacunae TaxID=2801331 RepID=A0ABS1KXZ3_9BACT|nr:hypothetical protein [Chryseolinea lacunae]MBL0744137.1 hypothetical protein [Chryseolinea lacunae]